METILKIDRILALGTGYRRHLGSEEKELAELQCLNEIRRCLQAMVLSDKKMVEQYERIAEADPGTDPTVAMALEAEKEQRRLLTELRAQEKEEYDRQIKKGSRAPEGTGIEMPRVSSSDVMNEPMPEIDYSGKEEE